MYPFNRGKSVTLVTLHGSRRFRSVTQNRDPKRHCVVNIEGDPKCLNIYQKALASARVAENSTLKN